MCESLEKDNEKMLRMPLIIYIKKILESDNLKEKINISVYFKTRSMYTKNKCLQNKAITNKTNQNEKYPIVVKCY